MQSAFHAQRVQFGCLPFPGSNEPSPAVSAESAQKSITQLYIPQDIEIVKGNFLYFVLAFFRTWGKGQGGKLLAMISLPQRAA